MSEGDAGGLFDGIHAPGPARAATTDAAWLQAMLDVEAALARAQAAVGLVPGAAAEAIATVCHAERFDAGAPTPAPGRVDAHDLVAALAADATAMSRSLRETLLAAEPVTAHLDATTIDELLDPAGLLGDAGELVDRARDAHAATREERP